MPSHSNYDRDPRVDAYIAGLSEWQQEICGRLRDLIHRVDPEMSETIKRTDRPYFLLDGNVCALFAAKDHVNLFLYDGAIVPDPEGSHRRPEQQDREDDRLPPRRGDSSATLTAMLEQIVANNRAGGWRKLKTQVDTHRADLGWARVRECSALASLSRFYDVTSAM